MTAYQAILAEARALAQDTELSVEERKQQLETLRDELQNLIDEVE